LKTGQVIYIFRKEVIMQIPLLPTAGYTPDIDGNFIEYFPEGTDGGYEIWAPVVNADV